MNKRSALSTGIGGVLLVLLAVTAVVVVPRAGHAKHIAAKATGHFKHPGVLVSRAQLDKVRKNIKKEPYKSAYAALRKDKLADPARKPHPYANVVCYPGTKPMPNAGCANERADSLAAYADALVWYISKNKKYLYAAGRIMDAYSRTVKKHTGDPGNDLKADAPLEAAWAGINFAKAAEIVRYSMPKGKKWKQAGRFGTMLRKAYLPLVVNGTQKGMNGNWDLASADATIEMAVYLDDHKTFDKAIKLLRDRVPAYFYLNSDGDTPREPVDGVWGVNRYWYQCPEVAPEDLVTAPGKGGPGECPPSVAAHYFEGQTQETCRDMKHPTYGIDATIETATTAHIQGVNLFPELKRRLTASMEFHAKYSLQAPPATLCGGKLADKMLPGGLEIGYTAYHKQVNLPYTRKLIKKQRPGTPHEFVAWDTLVWATP
ncbi:alginate lyase family protein [Actinocorallia longicatena]|uniref:Alginate lyase family protein n=1 Tax=Actinocorallia longicatena TaxID=111803 RepID=A0ABP6QF38_9ACTN